MKRNLIKQKSRSPKAKDDSSTKESRDNYITDEIRSQDSMLKKSIEQSERLKKDLQLNTQ